MKASTLLIVLMALSFVDVQAVEPTLTSEVQDWEAKQVSLWTNKLAEASALPPSDMFEALALGLRSMGHRVSVPGHSDAVDQIYHSLQNKFISTPGHAIHYLNKINAAKQKVRNAEMTLGDWSGLLMDSCETLKHMPSEETVDVLIEMGKDQFGTPWAEKPEDHRNVPGMQAWNDDMSSAGTARIAKYSYAALDSLGVEPKPYGPGTELRPYPRNLERLWEQWGDEVKRGHRRYRLKGSSIEHPINAPSTGREARRPERRPGEQIDSGINAFPKQKKPSYELQSNRESPIWPWIAGIGVTLLVIVVNVLGKRRG